MKHAVELRGASEFGVQNGSICNQVSVGEHWHSLPSWKSKIDAGSGSTGWAATWEGWGASETTLRLQHVRWRGWAFRKNSGREWTISVSLSVPLSVFLSNAVPQADSTRINDYA
jgi:hypothetical protein